MTVPLWILAVGSILVGLPGSPLMHHWFQGFVHTHGAHQGEHVINAVVMGSSVLAGLGGIVSAAILYLWKPNLSEARGRVFRPLYVASINKLWFDEIYWAIFVRPFMTIGRWLYRFDEKVVDVAVNGT